jgi:tetratricopeptide (TPR) repeat protein
MRLLLPIVVSGLLIAAGMGCHRAQPPLPAPRVLRSPQAIDDSGRWRAEEIGAPIGDYPWIAHVTTCDLDQDGLVDVLACDCRNQEIIWFRQATRGHFVPIVIASGIQAPVHVTPVPGGIYGSGHTDLIISAMGEVFPDNDRIGTIYILENDGREHFKVHVIADHIARVTDVQAGDLAGHGQKDLAVGCFGYDQGEISWMENKGGWKFETHKLLDLSGTINVCIADFCGHHANDIAAVVSQQWEEIYLFQNDGRGNFTPKILWGSTNQDYGSSGISACDLNGDGRPDILYTNGDAFGPASIAGPRPWHGLQWLENRGDGHFTYHRIADLPGAYSPVGVDLAGTGAMGVLVVSAFSNGISREPTNPSVVWYQNDGHQHFTPHILAYSPKDQITAAVGDLDGTGKPVIVTGGFYAFPPYDHMGRVTIWRPRLREASPEQSSAADVATEGGGARLPAELEDRISRLESERSRGEGGIAVVAELSRLYHANGLYAEAGMCYDRLMREDARNPRWFYRDAMIISGFGRLEDALPLFRRTVKLAPTYVPAWIRIGDAELKLNHASDAATAYDRAVTLDPGNAYALVGLARLDMDAGRWESARAKLEACVVRSQGRVGYDLLPVVFEKLGQQEAANRILAPYKAAGLYQDMNDPWLAELTEDCYDAYRVSLASGETFYRGDVGGAIRLAQRALALAPNDALVHYQLGFYFREAKRYDEAIAELRRSAELRPELGDSWQNWAAILRQQGDLAGATTVLETGLRHAVSAAGLHLEYGRLLVQEDRLPEAIAQFEASVRLRPPEDAAPYVELGEACLKLGRTEDGIRWMAAGLQVEPDHPAILATIALYEIKTGDPASAKDWLNRARAQPRIGADHIQALENAYTERFGTLP